MGNFRLKLIPRDNDIVPMKEPGNLVFKPNLTKRDIQKVVMQISEPYSTIEATEVLVKIIDITYAKANL